MKDTTKNSSKKVEHSGNTKRSEDEVNAIKRNRDEEIKACIETAKQKLGRLLKSKKQVIEDLAHDLERLGRRTEGIAAEIVVELRDCEEISKSLIYEYLDDKYKDPAHASRRKGKRKSVPETGTEPATEQEQKDIVPPLVIKKSTSGQDVVDPTPEENLAKTQEVDAGSDTDIPHPQHKQSANIELGTDSTMPQQQRTETPKPVSAIMTDCKDEKSQSDLLSHPSEKQIGCLEGQTLLQTAENPVIEFTIPREKYGIVKDAMDKSKASIFVKFDGNKKFLGADPDVLDNSEQKMKIQNPVKRPRISNLRSKE
jgi:hypothetical protein